MRAPLCSRIALVATVQPWMTCSISSRLLSACSTLKAMPLTRPNPKSAGVDGTFAITISPPAVEMTMSVEVSHVSVPTRISFASPGKPSIKLTAAPDAEFAILPDCSMDR